MSIKLPLASATKDGVIDNGTQTIAGSKTFSGTFLVNNSAQLGAADGTNTTSLLAGVTDSHYYDTGSGPFTDTKTALTVSRSNANAAENAYNAPAGVALDFSIRRNSGSGLMIGARISAVYFGVLSTGLEFYTSSSDILTKQGQITNSGLWQIGKVGQAGTHSITGALSISGILTVNGALAQFGAVTATGAITMSASQILTANKLTTTDGGPIVATATGIRTGARTSTTVGFTGTSNVDVAIGVSARSGGLFIIHLKGKDSGGVEVNERVTKTLVFAESSGGTPTFSSFLASSTVGSCAINSVVALSADVVRINITIAGAATAQSTLNCEYVSFYPASASAV